MAFKFVAILSVLSLVSAGVVPASQLYHQSAAAPAPYNIHAHPHSPAPTALIKTHVAQSPVAYAHVPVHHAQPVLAKHDDEYDPHPQYKYGYDVHDSISGDTKSQVEERDGDVVKGEYSLIDADGYKRVVQYTSDPHNGFNAVVNRIPLEHHVKQHQHAPVAYAAAPVPTKIITSAYPAHVAYQHHQPQH